MKRTPSATFEKSGKINIMNLTFKRMICSNIKTCVRKKFQIGETR